MTKMIVTGAWVIFVMALPLQASPLPRHSLKYAPPESLPVKQDLGKATKEMSSFSSAAPESSVLSHSSASSAAPVPPPVPGAQKTSDNASSSPVGTGRALSQNAVVVSVPQNVSLSNTSLAEKQMEEQNKQSSVSKPEQTEVEKHIEYKLPAKENATNLEGNTSKVQEESYPKNAGEVEVKENSPENVSPKSSQPEPRNELASNPPQDETPGKTTNSTNSANQTKAVASAALPVSPTPIKPKEEEETKEKDIPSSVKSSTSSTRTTTTTRGPGKIPNVELPKPPTRDSYEDYDEDQTSRVVPGGEEVEAGYQRPEEREPASVPKVNRGNENLVPVGPLDSGGKYSDDEDSHFFAYFLTVVVTAIIFYLVFHNKQRIIALIIEGRAPRSRSRRNSSRARYHKLDNNLEEAMSSTKGPKYERIF